MEENQEPMIEPIETVIGNLSNLEEKSKNPVLTIIDKNTKTPAVVVVSTVNESPDFKSMVKTPLETTTKKRRKCKRGSRRNKKTHRCRHKKGKR